MSGWTKNQANAGDGGEGLRPSGHLVKIAAAAPLTWFGAGARIVSLPKPASA